MKVEKFILEEQDKLEIVQQIPDETQKLFTTITPHRGHRLFEIDCSSGNITEAEYDEVNAKFETGAAKKKVIVRPNCLYISCLNKKSARKKFGQWLIEKSIQTHKSPKK